MLMLLFHSSSFEQICLKNVLTFFIYTCSSNLPTFTHSNTSQTLKIIEANMSALDLSDGNSQPLDLLNQQSVTDTTTITVMQPMAVVDSGMSIGARIMRQFRRNSMSSSSSSGGYTEKSNSNDLIKKKNMNSKAIEKLYLNKSLGRLKHTQLETIFEHEDETNANENYTLEPAKVFGKRKIKRSMSCSDGFNTTKTLKQKRQNRIRKIFGAHKKIKSISMKKFLEHLQGADPVDFFTPSASSSLPLTAITNGA